MKYRVEASVTWVIDAVSDEVALDVALERASNLGMDPKSKLLGKADIHSLKVNSVGQGTTSKMR